MLSRSDKKCVRYLLLLLLLLLLLFWHAPLGVRSAVDISLHRGGSEPGRLLRSVWGCRYPLWKFFSPRKVHPRWRSPDLSPIDRPYTSFYRHCSKFGPRLLRFRDIAGFVSQILLYTYPLVFHPKFGDALELDRWAAYCAELVLG